MHGLTTRQQEVLDFIRGHLRNPGYPPTRSEIARHMGFRSVNAAEEHLRALERKGAIEMAPGASRGIRIPEQTFAGLPIIGQVAAGSPILAEESVADYSEVPGNMFSPRADYLLTVKGDSMIGIGIFEDDLLAVHKTAEARNGDIVVARIEDEVTVKRLRRNGSRHRLELVAENPQVAPIEVDLRRDRFEIEGVSVGVIRLGC
ncbi:MAG: transcriptional repressor LexA [Gammaproteobacteria bacterium]|nr:transcriptional repressor LexA [Gammaproteobacteria bacterium]MCY3687566.1 transcriptional repressor LexA [Gammaproteobacteria bacterium]